jgi:hypothetical protein
MDVGGIRNEGSASASMVDAPKDELSGARLL